MGDYDENVYYGPHANGGTVTGRRLAIHKGSPARWVELGDVNDNQHAALVSAARTSQAAFDAQAASVWSGYSALTLGDKQDARAAVAAY